MVCVVRFLNEPQFAIGIFVLVLDGPEDTSTAQAGVARANTLLVELLKRLGPESGGANLAWLVEHLVDLAGMQLTYSACLMRMEMTDMRVVKI
jgi:hypothetical protein